MPRGPRRASATGIYHFITRGINKKKIFHRSEDFDRYKSLLKEYKDSLAVDIYHYCILSNHAHILLRCSDPLLLGRFGHFIQRRYAYYYCKTYHWSGQVFQSRYKSIPIVDETYLLECGRYIERNPVRAGIAKTAYEYPYCSYSFYALGCEDSLITESPAFLALAESKPQRQQIYSDFVESNRAYDNLLDKALI